MSDMKTQFYKLVRCYFNGDKIDLDTGLTLEEAQEWCSDPETSSRTCTGAAAMEQSIARGPWFDAYYKVAPFNDADHARRAKAGTL